MSDNCGIVYVDISVSESSEMRANDSGDRVCLLIPTGF